MLSARRLSRILLLLSVGAVAALCFAELALRVLDPFWTGETIERERFQRAIFEPHPTRPQAILRQNVHTEFLGHEVTTNADRMRGTLVPRAKEPGTYRIVVAGDSIAFGWGVAESDSFPRALERLLNAGPRPPNITRFEVINGGTPGFGLHAYYFYLQEVGLSFDPDLVVVTFINNDLTDIIQALSQDPAPHASLWETPSWLRWSYVARGLQSARAMLAGSRGDFFLALEDSPLTTPAIDAACQVFGEIRSLCGEVPMLVLDTLGNAEGARLQRFADCLAERGIERIDAFLPQVRYVEEFAITPTDMHPNAAGHRKYAEWIHAWMTKQGILAR